MISSHAKLARKLEEIEKHLEAHDRQILDIFEAIRALMAPPEPKKKKIGFHVRERRAAYGKKGKVGMHFTQPTTKC